jgi:hypothetical protein
MKLIYSILKNNQNVKIVKNNHLYYRKRVLGSKILLTQWLGHVFLERTLQ